MKTNGHKDQPVADNIILCYQYLVSVFFPSRNIMLNYILYHFLLFMLHCRKYGIWYDTFNMLL